MLPFTRIPFPKMWAAMAETGVGALGALAVGGVAVPVGKATGALPTLPQRPHGDAYRRHDQSSLNLPYQRPGCHVR
jgi:hypothetical protein